MIEENSFVKFKDGHEEDIIYYSKSPDNCFAFFATRSGVYAVRLSGVVERTSDPDYSITSVTNTNFYKGFLRSNALPFVDFNATDAIQSVTIDERIYYEYEAKGYGIVINGEIALRPDADYEEVCRAIRDKIVDQFTITHNVKEE